MPMMSLGQAARMTGQGKTTLARAIKVGKISANRREDGSYEIDPSELARVYVVRPEALETPETVAVEGGAVHRETPAATVTVTIPDPEVTARLAALEAEMRGLRDLLSEVRQSRDDWRDQAGRLALPRPVETPAATPATATEPPPAAAPRSWWRRLAG